MTIDEVIQEYKEEAEEQRKVAKSLNAEDIPFATIQFDRNYLQKIVDEKLKSIELDIQAIRNKAVDDVMEKCEIQSRVICDAEQQIAYYGLSIRELRDIVAGLKQESEENKNEK